MYKYRLLSLLLLLTTLVFGQWQKAPLKIPAQRNANLYRAEANAQQEIAEAIKQASRGNKRVLLVFGGNWCGDCHALDYAFHQPRIEPLLTANFAVVHVDVRRYDRNLDVARRYHVDLDKGVPSIVVLNTQGGLLYSTAEFERARMMTEDDVIQFLNAWKPPAPQAKK